jgi:hypothetical protein
MNPLERQEVIDTEHLRLLSLFYKITAGVTALFACLPIIHLLMGVMIIVSGGRFAGAKETFPTFIGWFFVIIAGTIILLGWALAVMKFMVGIWLEQRRHRIVCMVVSGFTCLFMPYGTILGVMAILVLQRPGVKLMFDRVEMGLPASAVPPPVPPLA